MSDKTDSMATELYDIYKDRIALIADELKVNDGFSEYFTEVCSFITDVIRAADLVKTGALKDMSLEDKRTLLDGLYVRLTDGYEGSFLNPDVAVERLGADIGRALSAVYAELTSLIGYAYEADTEAIVLKLELFLEIYGAYRAATDDNEEFTVELITTVFADHVFDHSQDITDHAAGILYRADNNGVAGRIIEEADLSNPSYLYEYGEYITDNEVKMSEYLAGMSEDDIDLMASVFIGGYVKGFEATGKDIKIKNLAEIRYFIGFERVVRKAVAILEDIGIKTSFRRAELSFMAGRRLNKVGYSSTLANRQFEADHENDRVMYFTRKLMEHRLMCYKNSLEKLKINTSGFGGPAVIESFGAHNKPIIAKDSVYKTNDEYNTLYAEYTARSVDILNEYVKGDERSFTIIAFPIPDIGKDFEKIFDETVKLNTLDYTLYRDIQQKIIDALDKAEYVHILGAGDNKTDIKVNLYRLADPEHETIFENCVADVNIPVGEVFTSPRLEGTEGILHVKNVYLNEMPFKDLRLGFKDGKIASYTCGNYDKEEDNKEYIMKYLLFFHETLPMGEFAIGTNTTAYMMTKRYNLESIMPILIAEKTGPHFAVGDTCYSHEEDMVTYNPDGKAIVARENSISALRKTDPLKAYFGCHTDITIPYDELKSITAISADGEKTDIIRDGRFVLKGCEELNKPLDASL